MRALAATDPATASVDDVRAQVESIWTAWDEVKASLREVTAADEEAVMSAGSTLETAVDDLATDIPISDMVSQVQAGAQPLKDTYKEMADGLGCTLQNPY